MIEYEVRVYDNGDTFWYFDGKLHRKCGPAVELASGHKYWYLEGTYLTQEEFNEAMNPVKVLTIAELEAELGYKIKVVEAMQTYRLECGHMQLMLPEWYEKGCYHCRKCNE